MHHLARSLVPPGAKHLLPRSPKRVVVIGGGFTGLYCADRLRHHFEVTVVDSKEFFEYTPGILRAVVNPAVHARLTFDYRNVLENHLGVEFVCGEAVQLDVSEVAGGGVGTVGVKKAYSGAPETLSFDYCVVAVGVSNGRWKPHMPWEPAGREGFASDERTIEARRENLRAWREAIARARRAFVVGAGLVGVELAAELAHFQPRLKVRLVDGAPTVLPQLAESARSYALNQLQQQGVKMMLGNPFVPESVGEDDLVLWCVGTKTRADDLFVDDAVLKQNGQVRVNRRMQVLRKVGGADSLTDPDTTSQSNPVELEPIGNGQVFAVGDTAACEGVPSAQMIYHGEEMSAVAVANIEAAENMASPFAFNQGKREFEPGLPLLCCTSLGPQDGMFSTQSELIATGGFAAVQKQVIEDTKIAALQDGFASRLLWMPIH